MGKARKKQTRKTSRPIQSITNPFDTTEEIDYKQVYKLKKFITARGRIVESGRSGLKQSQQRKLALEIKKARYMALLPFTEYA